MLDDLGPRQQTPTAQYGCEGGCGLFMSAPGRCLACWYEQHTYPPESVYTLPRDDPRRDKVRAVRDPRAQRPTFGRIQ